MRIVFTTSGGFAAVPGPAAPFAIDVEALPDPDAAELRQLVERSAFYGLTSTRPGPRAADVRTYTIVIQDGGREHTVTVADPLPPGDLRVLVERLRWHAAAARRRGP